MAMNMMQQNPALFKQAQEATKNMSPEEMARMMSAAGLY